VIGFTLSMSGQIVFALAECQSAKEKDVMDPIRDLATFIGIRELPCCNRHSQKRLSVFVCKTLTAFSHRQAWRAQARAQPPQKWISKCIPSSGMMSTHRRSSFSDRRAHWVLSSREELEQNNRSHEYSKFRFGFSSFFSLPFKLNAFKLSLTLTDCYHNVFFVCPLHCCYFSLSRKHHKTKV